MVILMVLNVLTMMDFTNIAFAVKMTNSSIFKMASKLRIKKLIIPVLSAFPLIKNNKTPCLADMTEHICTNASLKNP